MPRRPRAVSRQSLAVTVANALTAYAADEKLRSGDALPPVTTLSEHFQVSRAVVREALEEMETQGRVRREGRRWLLAQTPRPRATNSSSSNGSDIATAAAVTHRSLADQVADGVLQLILSRRLREGDPLPPGGELAERFGVSLIVMREALAALAARGILNRRQGRESTVARPSHELISSIMRMRSYLEDISVDEFQAARATLEMQAAALAATHGGREEREGLLAYVEEMGKTRSETSFNERDMAFHLRIAKLSGNRAIELLLQSLNDMVRLTLDENYRRVHSREGAAGIERAVGNHMRIAEAIAAGDPESAQLAMAGHFSYAAPTPLQRGA